MQPITTKLANDLEATESLSGGFTFVHLRDKDDGDTFQLGEDEIRDLHSYLGEIIIKRKLRMPGTVIRATQLRMPNDVDGCPNCGGKMLGDGYTAVLACENAEPDTYAHHEPDAKPVHCKGFAE